MTTNDATAPEPDPDVHGAIVDDELDHDEWVEDTSGPGLLPKMASELLGTFILVFMGVGTALFFSTGGNGTLAVAFGFAIGVIIAAVIFGGVSGAHLNPAVTVGAWAAGRFPGRDVAPYILSQVVGATLAGGILYVVAYSHPQIAGDGAVTRELISGASNGYAEHSPQGFDWAAGLIIEIIIAALLVAVVLAVTSARATHFTGAAPIIIGLTVGFLVLVAIPFTNGALNPARATGTALWSDTWALQQLWLFWIAPLVGALLSGLAFRMLGPVDDLISMERVEETVTIDETVVVER